MKNTNLYSEFSSVVSLGSTRKNQVEHSHSDQASSFISEKKKKKDRFDKTAASPNSKNLVAYDSTKKKRHSLLKEVSQLKQYFIFSEILKTPYDS